MTVYEGSDFQITTLDMRCQIPLNFVEDKRTSK